MRPNMRILSALIAILALAPGAMCLEIGGGSSARAGQDSTVQGIFSADKSTASSALSASGIVPYAGELRYVQDSAGKRAEMMFDVTGSSGVKYSATFSPKEGTIGSEAASATASQTLTIPSADSIFIHTAAQSGPGSNVAAVNLTASKVGASKASFTGSTLSQATAAAGLAKIQGRVVGSINGVASFGGSSLSGPYAESKSRSSSGQKVDCTLLMQASSSSGSGTISGVSTFKVDTAASEKIQAAIDSSWDGDTINIAKGTYRENLVLDRNLTVKGAGSGKTIIDGGSSGPVFSIGLANSMAVVALSDMTIQKGYALYGGGIRNLGTVTVSGCKLAENYATYGGAVYSRGTAYISGSTISDNYAAYGGGMCNNGTAILTKDTISRNSAINGGAVNNYGTVTITGSTLSGNLAEYAGGAVCNNGTATITGSTISGNSAQYGGGILNGGTASVSGSTVSGNYAYWYGGGGIYNSGTASLDKVKVTGNYASYGGGAWNLGGLDMTGCTVSGNSAWWGGGVSNGGRLNVTGGTVSSNTATYGGGIHSYGTTNLIGSTISSNTAFVGGGVYNQKNLYLGGAAQVSGNKATAGFGGGIYSTDSSVTFDGTKVLVKNNKANVPTSSGPWYGSWGVYITDGVPSTTGGFNPAKQVTGNTKL